MLIVLRRGGCLETWDIAKRSRIAVQQGSKEATSVRIVKGPVAVTGEDRGYAVPSLAPAEVPAAEPAAVIHEDRRVGVAGLDPALSKALAKWAAKSRVTLRTEASRTWLTPKLADPGEIRDLDLTADGKLLADNGELVRLDTGKHARFNAWTKSFTAMSDETFDAAVQVSLGPRSDRAVIQSVARMGAGPEIGSAILVDTGTMKRIGTLEATCQPNEVAWSPGGAWIVREPCDGGVLADHLVAVDSATGKVVRELPSRAFRFAEDDHTVVSGATVLDLTTGARVFTLPDADAP